ncbi:hypothetical protein, partial [Paractinoplanes durhamensis]
YGQQPGTPTYGQQPGTPTCGQQPGTPAHGQQPGTPAHGQQPGTPAYGQQPGTPAYGQQPAGPAYGAPSTPPAYGPPSASAAPAYGQQSAAPAYSQESVAPAYGAPSTAPGAAYGAPPAHGSPAGVSDDYPATALTGPPPQTACRLCGSVPAVDTKFRGHRGMIVLMQFLSTEGPFCRDCGLGVFRHMTSRTLVQGWYGYASLIIAPITVLMNLARRDKVASLAAPQPNPHAPSHQPMDPGPRLLQRPMTWIGLLIPVALVTLVVIAANSN